METLRYVLLVNGLLAVVTVFYYGLLRRETFFGANRFVLWLGLAASLVLPLPQLSNWQPQPLRAMVQVASQAVVPGLLPTLLAPQPGAMTPFAAEKFFFTLSPRPWVGFDVPWQSALLSLYVIVLTRLLAQFGIRVMSPSPDSH